jgi:hypothetical protein
MPTAADRDIRATADRLRGLKVELGPSYWQNTDVLALQRILRSQISAYAAWAEDKPPLHRRARIAARYEKEYAFLLWPGRSDE